MRRLGFAQLAELLEGPGRIGALRFRPASVVEPCPFVAPLLPQSRRYSSFGGIPQHPWPSPQPGQLVTPEMASRACALALKIFLFDSQ
jgi:hypothetical protein